MNNTPLFIETGWTCNSQCLSGNSLILKVATDSAGTQTQKVVKFVNPLVFLNLSERKQHSSDCTYLHIEAFLIGPISKHVLTYKACLSPGTGLGSSLRTAHFILTIQGKSDMDGVSIVAKSILASREYWEGG